MLFLHNNIFMFMTIKKHSLLNFFPPIIELVKAFSGCQKGNSHLTIN